MVQRLKTPVRLSLGHLRKLGDEKFKMIEITIEVAADTIYDWRHENSPDRPDLWLL
jgi:hypothetical protein